MEQKLLSTSSSSSSSVFEKIISTILPTTRKPTSIKDQLPVKVIILSLYIIIFVLGLIGNSLVVYIVLFHRTMRSITNIFIANLALSDILMCLAAVPFTPTAIYMENWVFSTALCKILPMTMVVSVFVSTLTSTAIAIDRHLAIGHPLVPRMKLGLCSLIIFVIWLIAILISMPLAVYQQKKRNVKTNQTNCQEYWPQSSTREIFTFVLFLLQFVIPCSIISYCYYRVSQVLSHRLRRKIGGSRKEKKDSVGVKSPANDANVQEETNACIKSSADDCQSEGYNETMSTLRESSKHAENGLPQQRRWLRIPQMYGAAAMQSMKSLTTSGISMTSSPSVKREFTKSDVSETSATKNIENWSSLREQAELRRKRRTNKMLIAMVIVFVICWIPLNVLWIASDINKSFKDDPMFHVIFLACHIIAMSSTIYNPFIYAWLNENFKKNFQKILSCFRCHRRIIVNYKSSRSTLRKTELENATVGELTMLEHNCPKFNVVPPSVEDVATITDNANVMSTDNVEKIHSFLKSH